MNNSEILIYQSDDGSLKIDVRLENETVWLPQKTIAQLFGVQIPAISKHLKNIFDSSELEENSVISILETTAEDGKNYQVKYFNLDVIIAVGYRVNSHQATQFRIWATQRLKEYIVKGFVLNDDRFKSGSSMNYFNELQERIRQIRISERFFYQKIKDIYTTSKDYDSHDEETVEFFKIIQNKLLWAVSQNTAAELVFRRVDASLPLMGMNSLDKKELSIKKNDVSIAKNYLKEDEMKLLGLIVEQYLAFAETMAQQQTPMYMKDWAERLDVLIQFNGKELLKNAGKISHQMALEKSALEYGNYKDKQKQIQHEENLKELEQDIKKLKTRGKDA
ncbi:MAG: RhuM family protein [Candidatus Delongbacteria bacterium]|jgi:hypothetical protein|nr:RhuM family protein [Candidatus Delongbacteria bacterium]